MGITAKVQWKLLGSTHQNHLKSLFFNTFTRGGGMVGDKRFELLTSSM
jgi:hypothetical protein